MDLIYKKASVEDIDFLTKSRIEILKAANKLSDDVDMAEVEIQSYDYYKKALSDGTHTAYLVFDGSQFIGAGGISYYRVMPTYHNPSGNKAYIMNMYTNPDYRRLGIATKTLEFLVADAKEKGVKAISLEATDIGKPLYQKFGFVKMNDEMELPDHMDYQIREIRQEEYGILDDFLYEAIFIPEGVEAPPKSIIRQPELQVYVSDFGKKDDCCLVAEVDGVIIGAVWTRIMNDYGHIDDTIPSFAISLYQGFRGQGIGTALMEEMLVLLRKRGYKKASLSVQKANYACRLYLKVGFRIVDENEEEYIMLCDL